MNEEKQSPLPSGVRDPSSGGPRRGAIVFVHGSPMAYTG